MLKNFLLISLFVVSFSLGYLTAGETYLEQVRDVTKSYAESLDREIELRKQLMEK